MTISNNSMSKKVVSLTEGFGRIHGNYDFKNIFEKIISYIENLKTLIDFMLMNKATKKIFDGPVRANRVVGVSDKRGELFFHRKVWKEGKVTILEYIRARDLKFRDINRAFVLLESKPKENIEHNVLAIIEFLCQVAGNLADLGMKKKSNVILKRALKLVDLARGSEDDARLFIIHVYAKTGDQKGLIKMKDLMKKDGYEAIVLSALGKTQKEAGLSILAEATFKSAEKMIDLVKSNSEKALAQMIHGKFQAETGNAKAAVDIFKSAEKTILSIREGGPEFRGPFNLQFYLLGDLGEWQARARCFDAAETFFKWMKKTAEPFSAGPRANYLIKLGGNQAKAGYLEEAGETFNLVKKILESTPLPVLEKGEKQKKRQFVRGRLLTFLGITEANAGFSERAKTSFTSAEQIANLLSSEPKASILKNLKRAKTYSISQFLKSGVLSERKVSKEKLNEWRKLERKLYGG